MKELFVFDDKNCRLYKYFEYKNIDAKELHNLLKLRSDVDKAKISYESLRRFFKKNINFKNKTIQYVLTPFNDYNLNYILTGEGEMIKMDGKPIDENYALNEDGIPYKVKKEDSVTQQDFDGQMLVEFRDLSVAAGPLNQTINPSTSRRMLVPREYDRGEYLVVKVNGRSMEDGTEFSIPNGANILIKKFYLENGEKLPIRDNLFVIDAKDGQALKQIVEHNPEAGYIICHSYNPEFKDYKVELSDVYGIYIFRKIIGHRPPVRDIQ